MKTGARLDLTADVVELTTDLVNIPSESFQEAQLADLVQSALQDLSHLSVDRIGNTVVARTERGRDSRVIIAGHLDTVPAADNLRATLVPAGADVPFDDPDGAWRSDTDRLFGLGSCDMKGGVAVGLSCAGRITEPSHDVTYVFYDCEEVAAEHSGLARVVAERPELLNDADFAILMEPSEAGVEAGCQGTVRAVVTTKGRRAHSARSWLGDNAIHAAGDVLARLNAYEPQRVDVDGLEYREGLNAVLIDGGVAGNVIPDACRVTVNFRFAPNRSVADAKAHVSEVFDGFDVQFVDESPGALPGLSTPAVVDFIGVTGATPRPKFGWTDVARFSALGIPALNFGPGDPGLAHTREEFVPIADLTSVAQTMYDWLGSS